MSAKVITEILASLQTASFPCACGVSTACALSEQADRKVVYHGLLIKLVFK